MFQVRKKIGNKKIISKVFFVSLEKKCLRFIFIFPQFRISSKTVIIFICNEKGLRSLIPQDRLQNSCKTTADSCLKKNSCR